MNTTYDIFTGIGYVDTTLYELYDTNDLRREAYFFDNGNGYYSFKGSYAGSMYANFTGISTNEMYLTKSECEIRLGKIQAGVQTLNNLLSNRYLSSTFKPVEIISGDEALKEVLAERRKELLFHGNRWVDIKRLNAEGADINLKRIVNSVEYEIKANSSFYALPIPDDIIVLTGIPQN